ncbi:hypothetical protein A3732_00635 [Oleiphilus sp. HI0050]|nr:hypothetical protein A3732_00635 [Oleiphilus sp. HI0050]
MSPAFELCVLAILNKEFKDVRLPFWVLGHVKVQTPEVLFLFVFRCKAHQVATVKYFLNAVKRFGRKI